MAALIICALALRQAGVPRSFGQFGHYRGEAIAEATAKEPRHLGETSCQNCHAEEVRLHDKDAHARVQCEVCHGPGQAHAADQKRAMRVPEGNGLCLGCHQKLAARPSAFPQIDRREHFAKVGVKDDKLLCKTCHNPHEPLYMDRDLRTARLHPLVHRCRDCHLGSARDAATPRPPGHPAIFECRYCHAEVVNDFSRRPHQRVECTTCHIFFKESEFAGRIIRDADPRFCLLCHGKGDYRAPSAPPSVEWPQHGQDMGGEEAAGKRCIDCHRDKIHGAGLGKTHGK